MNRFPRFTTLLLLLAPAIIQAQQPAAVPQPTTSAQAPTRDTSYIDAQGTAHVTRIVPVPKTISAEAQRSLSRQMPDQGPPQSLADRRKSTDAYTARARVEWSRLCPNQLVEDRIAGVPVRIVTPEGLPRPTVTRCCSTCTAAASTRIPAPIPSQFPSLPTAG